MKFVVDTSAFVAIRGGEPEREAFHRVLLEGEPVMSVATMAELTTVWQARFGPDDLRGLDELVTLYRVHLEPVSLGDATYLREGITAFGRGRGAEPAALNFGDLFAYALARRLGLPLLFKGSDFARAGVASACATSD